jgi:NAD+ synthase
MDRKKVIDEIVDRLTNFIGDKKAIVGISGGIDSSVTASLCVQAVGKENVIGVLMPYGLDHGRSVELGERFIREIGIHGYNVNITRNVDYNISMLTDRMSVVTELSVAAANLSDITKGNLMARERMNILYAFASHLNGLVIGTSNLSEVEIGYYTKYGDGGVDVEPIGALFKSEVYEIAKLLPINSSIIENKPSAGLWEGQTDEDEMGFTYDDLEKVIRGDINIKVGALDRIQDLRKNSKHKRSMPPTFYLDLRNLDR